MISNKCKHLIIHEVSTKINQIAISIVCAIWSTATTWSFVILNIYGFKQKEIWYVPTPDQIRSCNMLRSNWQRSLIKLETVPLPSSSGQFRFNVSQNPSQSCPLIQFPTEQHPNDKVRLRFKLSAAIKEWTTQLNFRISGGYCRNCIRLDYAISSFPRILFKIMALTLHLAISGKNVLCWLIPSYCLTIPFAYIIICELIVLHFDYLPSFRNWRIQVETVPFLPGTTIFPPLHVMTR